MYKDMTTLDMVKEFHKAFGADIDVPWDAEALNLRLALIREGFYEVEEAIDNYNTYKNSNNTATNAEMLLKELCDLQYVLDGTFVALGLDKQVAFNRVHKSNMSKLGTDGKPIYRDDGKVLKGPNYKEPDLGDLV